MSTVLSSQRLATPRGRLPFTFVTAFLAVCVLLLSMATWAAATEPVTPAEGTTSETVEATPSLEATAEKPAATEAPAPAATDAAEPAPAKLAAPVKEGAPATDALVADQPAAPAEEAQPEQLARVTALAAAARDPKAVDVVDEDKITVRNISRPPTQPWQQWDTVEITIPLTSADVAAADMPLQPGDFFTLDFPSNLTIFTDTVSLTNQSGVPVADCAIDGGPGGVSATGTHDVKCTFNDEISKFSSFTGTMRIGAQLSAASTGGPWSISVNGDTGLNVTVPGGGVVIGTPDETPTAISKDGWFEFDAADPTVMLWMIQIPKGAAANGEITITDTLSSSLGDHYILQGGANIPQLRVRSAIPTKPGDRNDRYGPGEAACPFTFTPAPGDQPKSFTAVISDACFDPAYYYTLYYRTKVTNPGTLVAGTFFGNTATVAGTTVNDQTGFYQYADGSLNGPGYGGVAARKAPIAGPAAGSVPATATYSVKATWTEAAGAKEQTMILSAGGIQQAINEIPEGTKVTLSELTLVSTTGVYWGEPIFSASNPNVVVAADKKGAVVTVGNQTVVGVLVTNTAFGEPSIDIEKWSTNEAGPAYDAAGVLTNDGYTGDHDGTNVKVLDPTTPEQITFTVSNDGKDDLKDIKVSDQTTDGTVSLTDIKCTFPDGSIGTTWTGPFAVATQFTCIATLPALGVDATHADTATVVGVGVNSGKSVTDEDDWSGETPLVTPGIDIEKYNTAEGFPAGDRDTAGDAKEIPAGAVDPVTMTISNTGNQPLVNVKVSDKTLAGVTLTGLSCTFPDGSTGSTWTGPFIPGAKFDCTGTIPAQPAGAVHANKATVVATPAMQVDGEWVPQPDVPDVTDNDDYHDKTPPAPVVPPTTPPVTPPAPPVTTSRTPLAFTGSMLDTLLPIGALTLLAGAALIILGRRRVKPE